LYKKLFTAFEGICLTKQTYIGSMGVWFVTTDNRFIMRVTAWPVTLYFTDCGQIRKAG